MDAPLDAREQAAWAGFLTTHATLWRRLEDGLSRTGVAMGEYDVLIALEAAGSDGLRMSALAERRLMSTGGLTRLVDRLVARGLVERRRAEDDGRGSAAVLTAPGRAQLRRARRQHHRDVREHFTGRLEAADLDRLAAVWERLGTAPAAS